MDVCISSGHGLKVRGAKGVLDEVDEARRVADRVADLLRSAGVGVKVFHDNNSTSVSANLSAIVNYHNAQKRDRDVSVHFNAFQTTTKAMGSECLYTSSQAQALAAKVSGAMAKAGGFLNRGAKRRTDLSFLNRTAKPAVLLEVCFVDSSHDAALYREKFEDICRGIAESIADIRLPGEPPTVEPPVEPAPEPTYDNVVDIAIDVKGDALVTLNGDPVNDGSPSNRIALTMEHEGDVVATINGEDFQINRPSVVPERPTLRVGARGNDVRVVQQVLDAQPIDGIFGSKTETAVKQFQTKHKLVSDGVVGPATWAMLEKVYGLPEAEPVVWQNDIIATVFGGAKDPNNSAYAPFDKITDTELSVALPWKFASARPKVRVINPANNKSVVCDIRDVGPWLIDDDYFYNGTRPVAETCADGKQPLPRGPHKGKVPNGAGIDLTPAAAQAIGLTGHGRVDWAFEGG
jgi:N-acetylmuramoyl-L-alanine amidase/Putative peptidoglycan binding domain